MIIDKTKDEINFNISVFIFPPLFPVRTLNALWHVDCKMGAGLFHKPTIIFCQANFGTT